MTKIEQIFDEARDTLVDEGVFSYDQIALLQRMLHSIQSSLEDRSDRQAH